MSITIGEKVFLSSSSFQNWTVDPPHTWFSTGKPPQNGSVPEVMTSGCLFPVCLLSLQAECRFYGKAGMGYIKNGIKRGWKTESEFLSNPIRGSRGLWRRGEKPKSMQGESPGKSSSAFRFGFSFLASTEMNKWRTNEAWRAIQTILLQSGSC